jgi:hypothetical protein
VAVQATMMGGVVVVLTSILLLLSLLDNPYHHGAGSLQPAAMQRTVGLLRQEARLVGGVATPCDARGYGDV